MSEFLPADFPAIYLVPAALVVVLLLLVWLWIRHRRNRRPTMASVFAAIAFERIDSLIVPNADEGEIQIDHLLLTPSGLLVIDVKDVRGTVFGSDKMQDWTVISEERRFTFGNPQPALYDRIAAVRAIVRQVPVTGRILFLDGAKFTKGVPGLVCSLDQLLEEFGETDKATAKVKVEAFKPHWEMIRRRSVAGPQARLMRYRHV
jgi:hypothetical protein